MNDQLNEITSCEVCGYNELISVLDLGRHPMCDDLVAIGDERVCKEYPIEILYCKKCYTAHQRYQVPKHDLFPSTYHYRSRFTADVLNGMKSLVASCEQRFGSLSAKKVLDIGCNDGSLLDFFRGKGAETFGIEPTDAYLDAEVKGHIIYKDFLSEKFAQLFESAHGKPDFITFTNVFAHIEDLQGVLNSLKILLAPHTIIVIENHYLGSVMDGNQFDTFYHEHPRTYSYNSFVHMARSLNIPIYEVEFPSRYGGNIRVYVGNASNNLQNNKLDVQKLLHRESLFLEDFSKMRDNINRWRLSKRRFIEEQVRIHGKMRAKAFPGRASILTKLLGLDENLIDVVYEKPGSMKIGHYVPGTRIPIGSDDSLFALTDKTQPLLNLAWHISSEIHAYLETHGYTGTIYEILSSEDFA